MSLKGFHVVVVSTSALLAFFFAAWCVGAVPQPGAGRLWAGAASVGGGDRARAVRGLVPEDDTRVSAS